MHSNSNWWAKDLLFNNSGEFKYSYNDQTQYISRRSKISQSSPKEKKTPEGKKNSGGTTKEENEHKEKGVKMYIYISITTICTTSSYHNKSSLLYFFVQHASCDVPPPLNHLKTTCCWRCTIDLRSHGRLVSWSKTFSKNAPGTIAKWRWEVSMDMEGSKLVKFDHPWYRVVTL